MNESYSVGAVFKIGDQFSGPLARLGEKLAGIQGQVDKAQKVLSRLGETKASALISGLDAVEKKFTAITGKADATSNTIKLAFQRTDGAFVETGRKLEGLGKSFGGLDEKATAALSGVSANFAKTDLAIGGTVTKVNELTRALQEAKGASGGIGRLPSPSGAHPRPGQGGSGGGHGGGAGGHGNTYGRHGVGIDAGIFGFMGFEALKGGVEATVHRGMELSHAQEQMRQAGISDADINRATGAAWKESRAYGLDVSKTLGDIKELTLPFGSVDHAIKFLEPLEKMRVVLNAVTEGSGNKSAGAVYQMARAGELKGLNNADDYMGYFDSMTKAISASGGKITPQSFAQVTQYGKLASQGWSKEFFTTELPTLMQTMNASTAGQSLMSLYGGLAGGAVSPRSFHQMEDLGLIGDKSKLRFDKLGNPVGFDPGAIKDTSLFVSNPLEWVRKDLLPLLEKKYGSIETDEGMSKAKEALGGLFGNRNSAAAVAELALREKAFDRDKHLIGQAHGVDGAAALLASDPTTAMNNFSAAWTNLLTALGGPAVKPATDLMNGLAGGMNRLGEFAQAHPTMAKELEGLAGGLAVGLGALAVVGLAAFAPGGLAAVAIFTLGGALAGLAVVNWEKIKGWGAELAKLPDIIGDAIGGLVSGIMKRLRALPGIGHLFDPAAPSESRTKDDRYTAPLSPEQKKWWDSGHPGLPGFGLMSFETGGASNDNMSPLSLAVRDGFLAAFAQIQGGSMSGGGMGGGGSGFINASYEADDGTIARYARGGGGPGAGHFFSAADREANIRYWAAKNGISPDVAMAVSRSEGFKTFTGDYGTSHGDFQMHEAGNVPGMRSGGLGDLYRRSTGKNPSDPHNELDLDRFALEQAAKSGWGPWHGAARIGIHGRHGMDGHYPVAAPPARRSVSPGAPAPSGATQASALPPIHVALHLDKKVIARHVVKNMAVAMRFPTSVGGPDPHGSYVSPGTPVTDAA